MRLDARHQALLDPRALLARTAHRPTACPSRGGGRGRCSGRTPCSSCACGSRASARPTASPGDGPAVVEPSPPPCGWSTGFMAVPRVCGRTPMWRLRPALPILTFWWSALPIVPIGRAALRADHAHLAGGQAQRRHVALLRHELDRRRRPSGRAGRRGRAAARRCGPRCRSACAPAAGSCRPRSPRRGPTARSCRPAGAPGARM